MRQILDHKLSGLNDALVVVAMDEPGSGGANHQYGIYADETTPEGKAIKPGVTVRTVINFQNGPIKEAGVNGISNEALLAVVMDRLNSFQSGPFRCDDNQDALQLIHEALFVLKKRTQRRIDRGVEGTNQK